MSVDQRFVHFEKCLIARGPDPRGTSTEFGADARHGTRPGVPQRLLLLRLLLLLWLVWQKPMTMTVVVMMRVLLLLMLLRMGGVSRELA